MESHLNRFEKSAELLGMEIPFSRNDITAAISKIVQHNAFPLSGVKILMTGGNSPDGFTTGKPNLIITNTAASPTNHSLYSEGVSVMTHKFTREMPEVKSTNYATALRLEPLWKKEGHIDVLYHDGELISEVSRSNVFLIDGDKLVTNQEGVLQGVTRMTVLDIAPKLGFEVEIRPISLSEVMGSQEVFMTSTSKRVMPIVKIDDHKIREGSVGEKTKVLMQAFDERVDEEVRRSPFQS